MDDWRANIGLLLVHAEGSPKPDTPFGSNRAYTMTNRLNHAVHKWVVEDDADAAKVVFGQMLEEDPDEPRIHTTIRLVRAGFDMFSR